MIRLALNATSLLSPTTGIAAYTRELARCLMAGGEVEIHFFYSYGWSEHLRENAVPAIAVGKTFLKKVLPKPYEISRFFQQLRFNRGVRARKPTLYHDPNYLAFRFGGPTVITVHDLSIVRYPETHPVERVRLMEKHMHRSIRAASEILVDSEFVKREVVGYFGVEAQKVHAIHLGAGEEYAPRPPQAIASALMAFGLQPQSYIFAVGTLEPRKNLVQVLDAFCRLPQPMRKRYPLIVAGMKGWRTQEIARRIDELEGSGEVRWLGYVPKDSLPVLYSGARMLVYPSLYEGFGLPVLEAMASGVPVITSNRASLPEVAGDAGIVIDPQDVESLTSALLLLIEDDAERQARIRLGLTQAAKFSWRSCAEQTLAVYKRAIAR